MSPEFIESVKAVATLVAFWAVGAVLTFPVSSYYVNKRGWKPENGAAMVAFWPFFAFIVGPFLVLLGVVGVLFTGLEWVITRGIASAYTGSAKVWGVPPPVPEPPPPDVNDDPIWESIRRRRREAQARLQPPPEEPCTPPINTRRNPLIH